MLQLAYAFCMTLLHSIWQAGLLLLAFTLIDRLLIPKHSPLAKRNFLYLLLFTQLVLSCITFFIYLNNIRGSATEDAMTTFTTRFLQPESMYAITPWLFSAYVFMIGYKLVKAFYTWYHFKQQYKRGLQKPGIELKLFTLQKAHQFGLKRRVTLWLSTTIHTPVTFGFLRPVILLPVALLNNIDTDQAETLILHELTHIRTNDYLLNWFLLITETIFFFNPFVMLLCKKIRLEREKHCDISVMAFEYPPALYAQTLLQAERIRQGIPAFQLAAVNRKKHLLKRIQFFSRPGNFSGPKKNYLIAPLAALLLLSAVYTATVFRVGNITSADPKPVSTTVSEWQINKTPVEAFIENTASKGISYELPHAVVASINQQVPRIEKQVKKLQPLIRSIQRKAAELTERLSQDFIMPVTVKENDATREIVIKEETSGTRSVAIKVYQLRFENGAWVLQPEWKLSAKEIIADSLTKKWDNGVKRLLPPQ